MTQEKETIDARPADGGVHVSLVSTLVAFALSRGLPMRQIEEATGLRAQQLGDPEARVPDVVPPQLWTLIAARAPKDTAITLQVARAAPFSALGGLAHGARFAANLREALGFLQQNRRLLADRLEIELVETADRVAVQCRHPVDAMDGGMMAETGLGIMVRLLNELLCVPNALVRVELAHAPLHPVATYEAFFKLPVVFERPSTALVFREDALTDPVSGRNAELFAYVEEHFRLALDRIGVGETSPGLMRLRRAIVEGAARGDYSATTMAQRAGMSVRAAQRLAAAEGKTLRAMLDDARTSNAKALLADPTIPLATVATLMGYSDERAFRRAFLRWTGLQPSRYRARL